MDPTDNEYAFELTVGEAAIHSVVKQVGAGSSVSKVPSVIKDMLNDDRVAEPTQQQMERDGAASEMVDGFDSRFQRAKERLNNSGRMDDAVEVDFLDTISYTGGNDGVMDIDELGSHNPTVVAVVKKVTEKYDGTVEVKSEYPLVEVGAHCVCTCQDRHYNRQQGGTCYHELAYNLQVADDPSRGPSGSADDVTIRV